MKENDKNTVVYQDDKYTLGEDGGTPYLTVNGRRLTLSCHPYEPCLYIKDGTALTAVHNAFDPSAVICAFAEGRTVTSITGCEYSPADFCRMVEYAAGMYDIGIDDAEKVFDALCKSPAPEKKKDAKYKKEEFVKSGKYRCPDDPFYAVIAEYPDCVIDYCIVSNDHVNTGFNAHRTALLWACRKLFFEENGELIWHYNVGKADGRMIETSALFTSEDSNGKLNYKTAFLHPPCENDYNAADFDRVNKALFPNGTEELEVYEWTTDWSEYFDDGHEWWGALCLTVYDGSLDRFAVILASATD